VENYMNTSTVAFGAPSTLLCAAPRPRVGMRHIAPISNTGHGTRLSFVGIAAVDPADLGRVAVDVTPMNAKQGSPPRGLPR
jgi:hypothetical protein